MHFVPEFVPQYPSETDIRVCTLRNNSMWLCELAGTHYKAMWYHQRGGRSYVNQPNNDRALVNLSIFLILSGATVSISNNRLHSSVKRKRCMHKIRFFIQKRHLHSRFHLHKTQQPPPSVAERKASHATQYHVATYDALNSVLFLFITVVWTREINSGFQVYALFHASEFAALK